MQDIIRELMRLKEADPGIHDLMETFDELSQTYDKILEATGKRQTLEETRASTNIQISISSVSTSGPA